MVQRDGKEDHLHPQAGLHSLPKVVWQPSFPGPPPALLPRRAPGHLPHDPHTQDRPEGHLESPVIVGQGLPEDDHRGRQGKGGKHVADPPCHIRPHPHKEHDKGAQHRHAGPDHDDIQKQEGDAQHAPCQERSGPPPQELVGADADKRQVESGDGQDMGNAVDLIELLRLRIHAPPVSQDHGRQDAAVLFPRRLHKRLLPAGPQPVKTVSEQGEGRVFDPDRLSQEAGMDILFLIVKFLIKITGISRFVKEKEGTLRAYDISCPDIRSVRIIQDDAGF